MGGPTTSLASTTRLYRDSTGRRHDSSRQKWQHNNLERHNTIAVKSVQRARDAAFTALGGYRCVRCGFEDSRALQIDHIFGGGIKELRRYGRIAYFKMVARFTERYQVLCANCNWIKKAENNENRSVYRSKTRQ